MERRERLDNLELLDLLEDGDDLEMTAPKETLYDAHNAKHTNTRTHRSMTLD